MRVWYAALALAAALAGCDASTTGDLEGGPSAAAGDTYTLEIRATSAEQTYLVIAPDGRTVGARAAEGVSALMDDTRAQALAGDPPPEGEATPEVMSLRLPGFSMSIGAGEENAEGEHGRVDLSIGGDGQNVVVHADEGGPGEADDRAYVRITGADAEAVRNFIAEAEELSPAVQAEMLAALNLQ